MLLLVFFCYQRLSIALHRDYNKQMGRTRRAETLGRIRRLEDVTPLTSQPAGPCSQDKAMPNKNPWESYNPACEYQNYATMNVLEPDPKDSMEMTPAEWEKCVNLPLDVQEGDFQTEV